MLTPFPGDGELFSLFISQPFTWLALLMPVVSAVIQGM